MNAIVTTPDVHLFVAAVRERLTDLTEEEREELVGGLEADMSDLVAERGVQALPEPAEYARELRVAAGFSPEAQGRRGGTRDRAMAWLDRSGATWDRWVRTGDHLGLPALAQTLRPVWWVVRALCATALVTEIWSSQGRFGFTPTRAAVALVLVVGSVQLGRGRWWPGTVLGRSLDLRLAVMVLNMFAILLLPMTFSRFLAANNGPAEDYVRSSPSGFDPALSTEGLFFGGRQVRNIYPYDAQGRPLLGVQLVDQDGRRLLVAEQHFDDASEIETTLFPWHNGRTRLFSVFPLEERASDPETGEPVGTPALQQPPFASLPPVSLGGVAPSRLVTPARTPAKSGNQDKSQRSSRHPTG